MDAQPEATPDAVDVRPDIVAPVVVTRTYAVAALDNDALEDPDGSMSVLYDWVSLYSPRHRGGVRFALADLPRGASVLEVYLEVYVDSDTEDDPSDDIHVESRARPLAFETSPGNLSSRPISTAAVSWIGSHIGAGWARSPSLVALVQPIVQSSSYAPGDAVVFVFVPRPDVQSGHVFEFRQLDFGPSFAARLTVRFTAP